LNWDRGAIRIAGGPGLLIEIEIFPPGQRKMRLDAHSRTIVRFNR
jgi:hypothetical protein